MLNNKGTIQLETDRLLLRRLKKSDAKDMLKNWAGDNEVTKYLSWKTHENINITKGILQKWIESYNNTEFYQWGIVIKKNKKLIGSIGVVEESIKMHKCEVGYCIGKEHWNQGIMTEALRKVLDFLLSDIGFIRVHSVHHIDNPASGKVMQKAGMKYEGRLRKFLLNNKGIPVDCEMYSIIKEDIQDYNQETQAK
jgi:ribosomal-protein-alanine N-acetyltransferase